MRATVDWLLRAHAAASDGGVALGYFPCSEGPRWRISYPETTGYIITSLLKFYRAYGDESVRDAALNMAHWEASIQMPNGAVQGGPTAPPERQTAAAFNTGMVLDGWCSVAEELGDSRSLAAAERAARFLHEDLDDAGYFRTNGAYVSPGEIKTYTCLCGWALLRYAALVGERRYRVAALRCVEAAARQQRPNGWFAHNCLTRSEAPLTHTLGYTLQGILEVGAAEARDDLIHAVERSMRAVIPCITTGGYLAARFDSEWRAASRSSCLTGSAQLAVVAYRLFALTGRTAYRDAADRLLNFLGTLHPLDAADPNFVGALAGSFPLFGEYMRGGYPNWATKYLLDALLLQGELPNARVPSQMRGSTD